MRNDTCNSDEQEQQVLCLFQVYKKPENLKWPHQVGLFIKRLGLTEAVLSAEPDSHMVNDVEANRRNGSTKKIIKAPTGSFKPATSRNRNGSFEPQLVKKHQTTLSNEIEQKIIRLFALGMSYTDISWEIEDLYAFSISAATISVVTP